MKTGTVYCISCEKTFNVYIHKKENQGDHINSIDSCKHHEKSNTNRKSVHKLQPQHYEKWKSLRRKNG